MAILPATKATMVALHPGPRAGEQITHTADVSIDLDPGVLSF